MQIDALHSNDVDTIVTDSKTSEVIRKLSPHNELNIKIASDNVSTKLGQIAVSAEEIGGGKRLTAIYARQFGK